MKVKCIKEGSSYFTKNKVYEVFLDDYLNSCVIDDEGGEYMINGDSHIFEVVQGDNLDLNKSYPPQKSLRDEFAIAAMQAFIRRYDGSRFPADSVFARWVYEIADAMLKAREEND